MAPVTPDPARIHPFTGARGFGAWLAAHHATEPEIWVKIMKKDSGVPSITWEEAVIEALCWGWIDGIKKGLDATAYLQRFTPRRKGSTWSRANVGHAERAIAAGRMQPPGLAEVEAAQRSGRWDSAYAGQSDFEEPADFLAALARVPEAQAFYDGLSRVNRYAVYFRLSRLRRAESRARKIDEYVAMFARGEAIHD